MVDHAICDLDVNRDGIDELTVAIQTPDETSSSIAYLNAVTGGPLAGFGFNLNILTGGVTLDGI